MVLGSQGSSAGRYAGIRYSPESLNVMSNSQLPLSAPTVTLAVVGDVHDQWDAEDERALNHLGVDLVLLVGDFGNEAVGVVEAIAQLSIPKAVVLGNHDAWYTATEWGRKKCPYDRRTEDRFKDQLDLLGEAHVGYRALNFADLGLSVVGGRPCTWGGPEWKFTDFYQDYFDVGSMAESADRIKAAAASATQDTVIFIGHTGPRGMGHAPEDPCGRDWRPIGGDYGDPDLAEAIAHTRNLGKTVPLVAFGHMHHQLRHRRDRLRRTTHWDNHTLYLNAAAVPRIIHTDDNCLRNFSLVTLQNNTITEAALVWLNADFSLHQKHILHPSAGSPTPQAAISTVPS